MITLEWLMALHERNPEALNYGLINVCFPMCIRDRFRSAHWC